MRAAYHAFADVETMHDFMSALGPDAESCRRCEIAEGACLPHPDLADASVGARTDRRSPEMDHRIQGQLPNLRVHCRPAPCLAGGNRGRRFRQVRAGSSTGERPCLAHRDHGRRNTRPGRHHPGNDGPNGSRRHGHALPGESPKPSRAHRKSVTALRPARRSHNGASKRTAFEQSPMSASVGRPSRTRRWSHGESISPNGCSIDP